MDAPKNNAKGALLQFSIYLTFVLSFDQWWGNLLLYFNYQKVYMFKDTDITLILKSIQFAAHKHRDQLRKDGQTPYINHPIEVAEVLWLEGKVRDPHLVTAAILHDTIEDTETTQEELRGLFGQQILSWVLEVTDDKSLPKEERKRLQIVHAPTASIGAKQIKIADKICNIRDLIRRPPAEWPVKRKQEYLRWSDQVVEGLRGCNQLLEVAYEKTMIRAWDNIK